MRSSSMFSRLSGLALLTAGLAGLVEAVLSGVLYPGHQATPQQMTTVLWTLLQYLYLAGWTFLALGLPGIYRRQSARAGRWGVAGFIVALVGTLVGGVLLGLLLVIPTPQQAQSDTAAASQPSPGAFILFVTIPVLLMASGAILLGIASLRARVFPVGAAILLLSAGIVGLVSLITPSPIDDIFDPLWNAIFFLAFGWFGAALLTKSTDDARTPERATSIAQPTH